MSIVISLIVWGAVFLVLWVLVSAIAAEYPAQPGIGKVAKILVLLLALIVLIVRFLEPMLGPGVH